MKERPVIFTADSVRAILEGRKTQTRPVIKPQPPADMTSAGHIISNTDSHGMWYWLTGDPKDLDSQYVGDNFRCPYGVPGDRLWVRETWATGKSLDKLSELEIGLKCKDAGYTRVGAPLWYPDGTHRPWGDHDLQDFDGIGKNRNALFMPRWASRITLEITRVRVQRVQDIGLEDVRDCEGLIFYPQSSLKQMRMQFAHLWDSINAKRGFSWESNPWVWAVTFRRLP